MHFPHPSCPSFGAQDWAAAGGTDMWKELAPQLSHYSSYLHQECSCPCVHFYPFQLPEDTWTHATPC